MTAIRNIALPAGPVLAVVVGLVCRAADLPAEACMTGGIAVWTATWWIFEPVPIPVASLLPFALLPLAGVRTHREVATAYGDSMILLLLGGFILSTAMEHCGVHRRLAVGMVRAVGGRGGRRLILGFMLASALLSMWISNTATVLMLLPVAVAALGTDHDRRFGTALFLGIAYAASIGGIGTPVGTPPNVVFMGIYRQTTGQEISFLAWMKIGIPIVLLFVPITWLWLTRGIATSDPPEFGEGRPWTSAEKRVLAVFLVTATLWITRREPLGGWSGLLGVADHAGDATVALLMVIVMFLVPDGRGGRLLTWDVASRIPWGILILFGGGIALAGAFKSSGLSETIGTALTPMATWPVVFMVLAICLAVTFLTEMTSNTATTTLLLPILAAAAIGADLAPAMLMIPATLSASCAFMLPVATAPNAIVYGSGRVPTTVMAREGLILNILGAVLITTLLVLFPPAG